MTHDIYIAFEMLQAAGACVLPKEETVRNGRVSKVWSGKKADGTLWTLKKMTLDQYRVTC
jgi:hypothetical protein